MPGTKPAWPIAAGSGAGTLCLAAAATTLAGIGWAEQWPLIVVSTIAVTALAVAVVRGRRIQQLERGHTTMESKIGQLSTDFDRIGAILAGMSEPVLAVDGAGELVLANRSAERLFELDLSAADHRPLANLIRCEQLIGLLDDARNRTVGSPCSAEIEIADEQGRSQWFNVIARGLSTVDEEPNASPGAVAVLRNISLQKTIQRRNAEFVSAVSHEMKTPLAGIKAYVELLADGDADDPAMQEEFLSVINSQANRLQRLVDNLLNLARIEAGLVNVTKRPHGLNELLGEALEMLREQAAKKQLSLGIHLSPQPLTASLDWDMLHSAAVQLISNAIKFTPPGGRIEVRSRWTDEGVQFEVADNGVGLSGDDCVRVFDKFYRVPKDKEMASGTGLGLSLARHIVEDVHGGLLTVTSELGRGSVFTVTLPSLMPENIARSSV